MTTNLLNSINGVFNAELVHKAASTLGETEASISKAVAAGVPSLLSGIMSTAGPDGGDNLLALSKQAADSGVLDDPPGLFGGPHSSEMLARGGGLLSGLFGSKAGGLAILVGNYAGVQSSTAQSIVSDITSVALAFIGRHAISNNLDGRGLLAWLTTQKDQIDSAVPPEINLANLFDSTHKAPEPVRTTASAQLPQQKKKQNKMLVPILLAIAGVALIWQMMKGCNEPKDTQSPATHSSNTIPAP